MLRISELNWPRILYTRTAAYGLGLAAVLSSCGIVINHSDFRGLSPFKEQVVSILGAASAFGFVALIICMGFFWLKCDSSSKPWKTFWFLILLIGSLFGSAVLYYVVVYLPAMRKGLSNESSYQIDIQPTETDDGRNRLGPFRRLLLVIWAIVILPVFLVLSLASISSFLAEMAAVAFFVWSSIVVLEAVFHWILSLYRSGMTHSAKPDRPDSSRLKDRD